MGEISNKVEHFGKDRTKKSVEKFVRSVQECPHLNSKS